MVGQNTDDNIVIVDVLEENEKSKSFHKSGRKFALKLTNNNTIVKLYDMARRIHEGMYVNNQCKGIITHGLGIKLPTRVVLYPSLIVLTHV